MVVQNKRKEEQAYYKENIVEEKKKDYYAESINALVQYMKENKKNPSEKQWDQYAICKKYLSSKTIGYLSGIGFNTLCRKKRKEINKKKRQIK